MPISYFAEKLEHSESTIIRYNKTLEEMKIMCVYRSYGYSVNDSGEYYKPNNYYSSYSDRYYLYGLTDEKDVRYYKKMITKKDELTEDQIAELQIISNRHNELELKYQADNPNYIPRLLD